MSAFDKCLLDFSPTNGSSVLWEVRCRPSITGNGGDDVGREAGTIRASAGDDDDDDDGVATPGVTAVASAASTAFLK